MTEVERLARFVCARSFADLSGEARAALRVRVLDAYSTDLSALDRTEVVATTSDEITTAVSAWLERFLAAG